MTVEELIKELEKMDKSLTVYVDTNEGRKVSENIAVTDDYDIGGSLQKYAIIFIK